MAQHRIGVIVATHGRLSHALVDTAEAILGHRSTLLPFEFLADEEPRASAKKLQALIRKTDKGSGVIILVDLFGGTPGSLALSLLDERSVEVVTGVNLPMVLTAAGLKPGEALDAASSRVAAAGREAIQVAMELLKA